MVGLNPGQARVGERRALAQNPNYKNALWYWKENIIFKHKYYNRLRKFADDLNLRGPILWTELVKCQSRINGKLNISTIRADINQYLFRELQAIPKNWPIIGVGQKPFEVLAYRFPERLIIGVPHVIGSYGQFHKLFNNNAIKLQERRYLKKVLQENYPIAIYYSCHNNKCKFV